MREIVILTHIPTDSINLGFLPAARALGLKVIILTDCLEAHLQHFRQPDLSAYPDTLLGCDVFNPLSVIETISSLPRRPAAIFSNSDHLQTATALAAAYFDLPGKDWQVTYRTKNKAEMRSYLSGKGVDSVWHRTIHHAADLAEVLEAAPYPCVVKPREGVASQHVHLAGTPKDLEDSIAGIWQTHPRQPLLVEEYLDGPLLTLETLGDGKQLHILGGFQVTLSPPPYFVELSAQWGYELDEADRRSLLAQLKAAGVQFGSCHTEFVLTPAGPRLIEINYRTIGDYREFLLDQLLDGSLFETILGLHLGEPLPVIPEITRAAHIHYVVAGRHGRLQSSPVAFNRQVGQDLLAYYPLRRPGEAITITHSNKDYLGVLHGIGSDTRQLQTLLTTTANALSWELKA